jgi:hypothetical protein
VLRLDPEPVPDRRLAGVHGRSSVDPAGAPAAPSGVAHQSTWAMEPEAPRQRGVPGGQEADRDRFPLEPLDGPAVEEEADRSSARPVGGRSSSGGHRQRRWKVGELSMHTRLDSR